MANLTIANTHPSRADIAANTAGNTAVARSSFLAHLTDDQIREGVRAHRERLMVNARRLMPGARAVDAANKRNVAGALADCNALFEVAKMPIAVPRSSDDLRQILQRVEDLQDSIRLQNQESAASCVDDLLGLDTTISGVPDKVATVRLDTGRPLNVVGNGYGVVQTMPALASLDALCQRGDAELLSVEQRSGGGDIRVTALVGVTEFTQADGAPNTLAHLVMFEVNHTGERVNSFMLETIRVECFNGMTSRTVAKKHTLRHTSRVGERVEDFGREILAAIIGDVEAEREMFLAFSQRRMTPAAFTSFATEWLGGDPRELEEEKQTPAKLTRFDNAMKELEGLFADGNQGAGATAYGAYNSVTRFLEGKKERLDDWKKAARKFQSNLDGEGQRKRQRAVRLLER